MESDASEELNLLVQAAAELSTQSLGFLKSMSLKCAIDLGIPDAIQNHGEPMTLSELHSALSLPASRKPQLARLLRIVAHYGFLFEDNTGPTEVYDLTTTSCLAIEKRGYDFNLFSLLLDSIPVKSSLFMCEWFKQEDKQTPLDIAYGCSFWEMANRDARVNKMFNDSMASCSGFYTDLIVNNYGDVFQGIESLIDIGGGTGAAAKVIVENFAHVKCTVLDLPQVVGHLPNDGIVKFVSGDMFSYVPRANAVLLKWILHDWSDEACIKILKLSKEAIPSKEAGGKVIVVETVVGSTPNPIYKEVQLLSDMFMMTLHGGKERDELEWKKLFEDAGFSGYKITHILGGLLSILEVYP